MQKLVFIPAAIRFIDWLGVIISMKGAVDGLDLWKLAAKISGSDRLRVIRTSVKDVVEHPVLGFVVQCPEPSSEAFVSDGVQ